MNSQDTTSQNATSQNAASQSQTKKFSNDEVIAAIKQCAAELGHPPSRAELLKVFPISLGSIYRRFGNYMDALRACGLEREGCGIPVRVEKMFGDWARVVRDMGRIPTGVEYDQRSNYSHSTLGHHFSSWNLVPAGMLEYARANGLDQVWADVLEIAEKHCQEAPPRKGARRESSNAVLSKARILTDRPVYGALLMGEAMGFAPVNEMGVVFLFGAKASKLGFIVTFIGTQYPDIEAYREVAPGRWQRVRIEVEFESRNFKNHLHDPRQCDLIVCWEHNWPECPIEVVELKGEFMEMARMANIG